MGDFGLEGSNNTGTQESSYISCKQAQQRRAAPSPLNAYSATRPYSCARPSVLLEAGYPLATWRKN